MMGLVRGPAPLPRGIQQQLAVLHQAPRRQQQRQRSTSYCAWVHRALIEVHADYLSQVGTTGRADVGPITFGVRCKLALPKSLTTFQALRDLVVRAVDEEPFPLPRTQPGHGDRSDNTSRETWTGSSSLPLWRRELSPHRRGSSAEFPDSA